MRYLIFLLLLLITSCRAVDTTNATDTTDAPVDIISDLQSHCSSPGTYSDSDLVTTAHETTHGVNSDLRNKYGKPCFYALNGKVLSLPHELNTTLSQVAASVPEELRGRVFRLYLIEQQSWWQNQPSYILDELSAYTNGVACSRQRQVLDHGETSFAVEFLGYAAVLVKMTGDNDARAIVLHQANRLAKLSDKTTWPAPVLKVLGEI